ncbi:MAG TPA: hypothetical protein PLZ84_07360, partial [Clostridia bacterium]|nr:hypothetical protein [Clostridia bacterium]
QIRVNIIPFSNIIVFISDYMLIITPLPEAFVKKKSYAKNMVGHYDVFFNLYIRIFILNLREPFANHLARIVRDFSRFGRYIGRPLRLG